MAQRVVPNRSSQQVQNEPKLLDQLRDECCILHYVRVGGSTFDN